MPSLEILGTIVGLLYIWLEYRASIWLWAAGIIMPAIYIVVYFEARLYADAAINIYYLLAAFYGIAVWLRGRRKQPQAKADTAKDSAGKPIEKAEEVLPIRRFPLRLWRNAAIVSAALTLGIVWMLGFTDSDVRWLDALTTALSIVAMWMLAQKYAEQWLLWIVVDAICVGLYIYKELHATAALYALYCVIAVFGYLKWCRMASKVP